MKDAPKLDTAKKGAAYTGIAPYPKESGKMKCGQQISPMGDKQLITLPINYCESSKACYDFRYT